MLQAIKMTAGIRIDFLIAIALRLQCKGVSIKIHVIVKNRFLQEAFKLFRRISCKLFEVFDEVRLIEEIILVAYFDE